MKRTQEVEYRLNLAEGFILEAREDMAGNRWRACVSNSQLAVENAAKAALALLGPVGRTHNPAPLLVTALAEQRFRRAFKSSSANLPNMPANSAPTFTLRATTAMRANGKRPGNSLGKAMPGAHLTSPKKP